MPESARKGSVSVNDALENVPRVMPAVVIERLLELELKIPVSGSEANVYVGNALVPSGTRIG